VFGEDAVLPSWVPNFRDQFRMKVKIGNGTASAGVFDLSTPSTSIDMDARALVVSGVDVDRIATVHELKIGQEKIPTMPGLMQEIKTGLSSFFAWIQSSDAHSTDPKHSEQPSSPNEKPASRETQQDTIRKEKEAIGPLYLLIVSLVSRFATGYRGKMPPLQAVLRVIWCHGMGQRVLGPTIMRGVNFLKMLALYGPGSTEEENMQGLGFAIDANFDATFHKKMFPVDGLETQINAYKGSILREFEEWEPVGGLTELLELKCRLSELSRTWSLVETEDGYLGLGPKGSKPGDVVAVLKGCDVPVVLRRNTDHFKHVGTSFILGLMDGELAGRVSREKLVVQEFRIL
jgi:hypothetical protein